MIVRIETAGLTRGREFKLFAYSSETPSVELFAYDPVDESIERLSVEIVSRSPYHIIKSVAPHFDGYLLAKVGRQKIIKRIGTPFLQRFLYGYRPDYTVPYKLYDENAEVIREGILDEIIDGFYKTPIDDRVMMVEAMGKKFLINKNIAKLNYQVTMRGGRLGSSLPDVNLNEVALPQVQLDPIELGDVTLDSTLPEVEIKEL